MMYKTAFFVLLLAILTYLSGTLASQNGATVVKTEQICTPITVRGAPPGLNVTFASMQVPAIDPDGKGVVTTINVQTYPGTGETLTNIDKLFFWVDTQHSIKTAREVAQNVTGLNLSRRDIVYTITAPASLIEGPSAGAALTVATIAALKNLTIRRDVMITGTINPDGTLGSAGAIGEKAIAARKNNATLFIVPSGSIGNGETIREKACNTISGMEYCEIKYVRRETDISNQTGIKVKEVNNIQEALKYLIG